MGVTEKSYTIAISKLKATAFKKYATRYQVSYIRKSLRKPSQEYGTDLLWTYAENLTEVVEYLKHLELFDSTE